MKFWKMLRVAGVLSFVFAAGVATGVVGLHYQIARAIDRGLKLDTWTAGALDNLQSRLKLTPEQRPRVRAILEETGRQFRGPLSRAAQESGEILVKSWGRVDLELTPAQREAHHKMCQEFRDALKSKLDVDLPPL